MADITFKLLAPDRTIRNCTLIKSRRLKLQPKLMQLNLVSIASFSFFVFKNTSIYG
jgi:hypothetical protein